MFETSCDGVGSRGERCYLMQAIASGSGTKHAICRRSHVCEILLIELFVARTMTVQ